MNRSVVIVRQPMKNLTGAAAPSVRRARLNWLVAMAVAAFSLSAAGTGLAADSTVSSPLLWDTFSDTWVATDALGRKLPMHLEVGPPRTNKFVGIFYFLWLGQHGDAGPFDITKILAADPEAMSKPDNPLWGPLHVPHHWGESIFGYYVSDDEGVLAKHAQMLADADIDAVIFDVTNQLTYPRSWRALCRVWDRIRRHGGKTPQIAFLCPFWNPKKVVRELYNDLYGPGLYPDLWFRWEGKPLILADPTALSESTGNEKHDTAVELVSGHTLGQSFTIDKPLDAVGGCFPTWTATDSVMTLALYRDGPKGVRLSSRRFQDVQDNAWLSLKFTNALPPGAYYLEMSGPRPSGKVGWWSHSQDLLPRGQAFSDGLPVAGDRTLRINFADERAGRIREFFTFRRPQPNYFAGPRGPDDWGWLEVYPQHAFTNAAGRVEEVTVGVAQNAVDGKLSVLSNPRSHGRSFHDGQQPRPDGQDFTGRNFSEQWQRAFELGPAFIFITGWNEWIAGRFKPPSGFYGDGPVTFVDQFNREYSRDLELMKGGHGGVFYYQMIANVRRFKGARPLPSVTSQAIRIDGRFDDWAKVEPEFRDQVDDPVQRDHPGWGKGTRYVNQTGRNDLIAARISSDAANVYFYVRTREPLTSSTDTNWMLLFLDTDGNPINGWLGYDFVVNRSGVQPQRTTLERHEDAKRQRADKSTSARLLTRPAGPLSPSGGEGRGEGVRPTSDYRWGTPSKVDYCAAGNELELAIPCAALGITSLPATIDFKWADNVQQTGEASDFTLNGDAAPNDRFNYRAVLNP